VILQSHEIRKNIRAFNGFAFDSGSTEYDKKKATMEKMTKADLTAVAGLLGTEKSKEKTEIITKILDFLLKPADSGRAAPGSKKSKSRKSGTKRRFSGDCYLRRCYVVGKKTTKAKKEKATSKDGGDESKTAASSGSDATSDEDDDEEEEEKPAVEEVCLPFKDFIE
jgi:protein DEK